MGSELKKRKRPCSRIDPGFRLLTQEDGTVGDTESRDRVLLSSTFDTKTEKSILVKGKGHPSVGRESQVQYPIPSREGVGGT